MQSCIPTVFSHTLRQLSRLNPCELSHKHQTSGTSKEVCRGALLQHSALSSRCCLVVTCIRNHFELSKLPKPLLIATVGRSNFQHLIEGFCSHRYRCVALVSHFCHNTSLACLTTLQLVKTFHAFIRLSVITRVGQSPLVCNKLAVVCCLQSSPPLSFTYTRVHF